MLRTLLFLTGTLLAIPVLALITLVLITPVTLSGGLYLSGSILVAAGLILAAWQPKYLWMALGGLALIFTVAGARLSLIQNEASKPKVIVLPSAKGTRPVNALIDEQDSVLFGERLLSLAGGVSSREQEGIIPALSDAYREARSANGVYASPFASTYLGLQKPAAFDAVVIEPTSERSAQVGVIFLHGFMGNVSVQCWQIARAVEKFDALTVCPSTIWTGDWWTPGGKSILQATFQYLRGRGIERIYLGGFSNGGNG